VRRTEVVRCLVEDRRQARSVESTYSAIDSWRGAIRAGASRLDCPAWQRLPAATVRPPSLARGPSWERLTDRRAVFLSSPC
jgi:hypothetical protein